MEVLALTAGLLGLATAAVLLLLLLHVTSRQQQRQLNDVPGPRPVPVLGNVFEMIQVEAVDLFLQWIQTYGKIVKYQVFLLGTQVMVADAEALKRILVTNYTNYKKPESLLRPVRKIFGERSLICLQGKEHALRRKLLHPAFKTTSITSKVGSVAASTHRMIRLWRMDGEIEIQHDLTRLSLDALGDTVFGFNFDCLENPDSRLTSALYRVMSVQNVSLMRLLPFYNYLPTQMNRDLQLIRKFVSDVITNKERCVQGESSTDMLDLMLQSRGINSHREKEGAVTDDDITDDVILFLIAGHETVTNSLCWVILELATNAEAQERCRAEVLELIGRDGRPTYDLCNRMTFLECCIKESLRLHPPVQLTARQAIRDDTLGGHFIPAGTVIALQLGAMMRHPDYYEEPAAFRPDRFLDADVPRHHFLPFLAGPDMCIGHKLAMQEMKTIMSVILQNVRFALTKGAEYRGTQGLTYHMTPPLTVRVTEVDSG